MTFYQQEVLRINRELYPREYLTKQVIVAKQYIDLNFAEDISLDNLAARAFMSKFYFSRYFKSMYGSTPHQYLTSVRMENARKQLRSGKPITEVCISVGFNSFTSFTALFKKNTGVTPSTFKNNFIKKQFPRGTMSR